VKLKVLLITFVLGSILTGKAYSQNQREADSLISILDNKHQLNDSSVAVLYKHISIRHGNATEGLFYAQQFLDKSIEIGNRLMQAEAHEEISLKHRLLGNSVEAFKASYKALSIYESLGKKDRIAASHAQNGSNYILEKSYDKAIKHLNTALIIYDEINDLFNSALTHINLGEAYRLKPDLDSASYHFLAALKLNIELQDDIIEGYSLGNLGMVQAANSQLKTGIRNMQRAIGILTALGDNYSVAVYKAEIGKAYIAQNLPEKGEAYLIEGLDLARLNNLKEQIRDISADLSHFYEKQGDYAKSLTYQKQFQVYQDSLINKENIQKIEQLKSGYELDKKESEIRLLSKLNGKQRQISYLLGSGIAVILILTGMLYKNNQQRKRTNAKLYVQKTLTENREHEKSLLLKELNHRVKNNLQMVSSLLNLQSQRLNDHPAIEAVRAGRYRVEAMSLIHQKLYQEDHHTQIVMKDYIEELVRNLIYSYNKEVDLNLRIENLSVDIDRAIPLALIVNELVTNALKYAYGHEQCAILTVQLYKMGREIHLKVEDNGIGTNNIDLEKSDSFGLQLVKSLTEQLDGTIELKTTSGTHWHLTTSLEQTA